MQIIGISGKKQSGKDTLGAMLVANSELPAQRVAFADALKEEVAAACGVTIAFIETNKTVFRPILQWWGTDFRRRYFGDDYWVVKVYEKILEASKLGVLLVVITDTRFQSEFNALKKLNACMVRIARPSQLTGDTHLSETDLDACKDFDELVINNGPLADLEKEAKLILAKNKIPLR